MSVRQLPATKPNDLNLNTETHMGEMRGHICALRINEM